MVAAGEVTEQARALGIGFDAVVCASGSALTHAGLLVGLRALGWTAPVLGICVRRDAASQGARVAKLAAELAAMIGALCRSMRVTSRCMTRCLRRATGGWARRRARRWRWRRATRRCSSTRSTRGKAMAGLIAHVREGRIAAGSRVLFIHTGGQPALFAYAGKLGVLAVRGARSAGC